MSKAKFYSAKTAVYAGAVAAVAAVVLVGNSVLMHIDGKRWY